MPKRKPVVADCVRELLAEFPDAPSRQLASVARKRWPVVFGSVEAARNAVRRVRGSHGASNRRYTKDQAQRPASAAEHCKRWGALIPAPEPNDWAWQDLPAGPARWLVLADIHVPFHDPAAIEPALRFAEREGTDGVLLLGDVADCYRLSPWLQDPRQRRFPEEVSSVGRLLDCFAELKPKSLVWKGGNHEYRLERYLMSRAPDLFGMPQFTFASFLDFERRGITWVPAMNPIRVGKLAILHGHEFGGGFFTPVNPARTAFLRAKACALVGHLHRTSEHTEQTIDGTTITCWSAGCLCDLHPQYRPVANGWNHGFAVLDVSGESWRIRNYRIVDGEVV